MGNVDQVKNGGLGLNSLAVFGNSLFGGSTGSNAYMNFGDASGASGYGIRDNAGTMEFKNSGDTSGTKNGWYSLQELVFNLCNGGACGGGTTMGVSATWSQSLSNSTWTTISNVTLVQRNDAVTSTFSGGVYTVGSGEECWYVISADAAAPIADEEVCTAVLVNGGGIGYGCSYTIHGAAIANATGNVYLNVGDSVSLGVRQISGGTETITGRFSLVRVGM